MKHIPTALTGGAATATLTVALTIAPTATAVPDDTQALRDAVTVEGVMKHLEELQAIADANEGNRASGSAGYDGSADYVADLLEAAGYEVERQTFDFPFFAETADPVLALGATTYVEGTDFYTMEYSGSGDVSAPLEGVDLTLPPGDTANSSTSGCELSDFAGFTAGNVALIQRGTCSFALKAQNAEAAGASAAIIFNEGQEGRTDVINGTLGGPGVEIPVLGTTFEVGQELADAEGTEVHVFTETESVTKTTSNVIADTPAGRAQRTVVVGAHLDSVPEGAGINDNGSGSATILEIALQMADLGVEPVNRVRFAFWGAEESGLVGSEYYVASLTPSERNQILLNLNFDMVGSPNYVRFVYDGDGSDTPVAGPRGSGEIERVLTEYFASAGLSSEPTEFSGRSDYGPFIAVGIPAGGLFTGAEGQKTEEQAEEYGGVAGASYDPCYHAVCDDLEPVYDDQELAALYAQLDAVYDLEGNVNLAAIDEMSDAAAHATQTFAMITSDFASLEHREKHPPMKSLTYHGHAMQR